MNIAITALVLFGVFAVLLILGCPISISIAISSIATTLVNLPWDQTSFIVMQKMNSGVESFSLLAVPLFILAGNIMNNGGIARRLIRFAQLLSGRIPGSLAHTNVLANMFFGALSGSAVAAASAIGGIMAPMEEEEGYDPAFATCVNIASAPTGLLIPPTSAFIVYSTVAGGVSVSALFMAGYVPGILMGLSTMAIAYCYAKKHNYPVCQKVSASEAVRITLDAIPSLLLIVIVIGGIVGGIFTATEGSVVAVVYSLILSLFFYKSIKVSELPKIFLDSAEMTGIIIFLIGVSSIMSWVMAFTGIPTAVSEAMLGISNNRYVILFIINILLLIIGTFMDMTPACLIFTPIFLPICQALGMNTVHFGIMMIFNLCIGTITPPVGTTLFVGVKVGKTKIENVIKPLLLYFAAIFVVLLLVSYVPILSMWLPGLLGYV